MADDTEEKTYSNGDITISWKPALCQHSGICAHGLRAVFDPKRRPWIDLSKSDSVTIAKQVAECPSGALSLKKRNP